ncbi:MAG: MerC domain-containing protein [Pseudomonadota bacterium]|nr:MerC domain-containing protein [Pseudomonadota bacterium]
MTILRLTLSKARPWDLAGIGASALCILHCVATPLLVIVLPALEIFERQTHAGFALSILCIGLLAFVPGYRRHRRWQIVFLGLIGFGMLSAGVLVPEGGMSEAAEVALTVLGGTTLITAHLRNAYFCLLCRACGRQPCAAELADAVGA